MVLTSDDRRRREHSINEHDPLCYTIRRVASDIRDVEVDLFGTVSAPVL